MSMKRPLIAILTGLLFCMNVNAQELKTATSDFSDYISLLKKSGYEIYSFDISALKDEKIIKFFISQIEKNYFKMCEDQYANYVIQYVIEIFGYSKCKNIINLILNNFLIFAVEKYPSNVIDKVIIEINENAPFEFYKLVNNLWK